MYDGTVYNWVVPKGYILRPIALSLFLENKNAGLAFFLGAQIGTTAQQLTGPDVIGTFDIITGENRMFSLDAFTTGKRYDFLFADMLPFYNRKPYWDEGQQPALTVEYGVTTNIVTAGNWTMLCRLDKKVG